VAENQQGAAVETRRALRAALALATLAVVLVVVLVAAMARVDGQAKAMRDDLDGARLRQYGVLTR
jgi:hypothetical protein